MAETLSLFAPELSLVVGAMALLIFGVFNDRPDGARLVASVSTALLVAAALIVVVSGGEATTAFDGAFRFDAFAAFAKIVIFIAAAFAIAMSSDYPSASDLGRFEYPILILLAAVGMALMVSANDLIALYMGVETQSLALYILAAFNRDSRRSTEAGLKYFVLGALSSGLLLYGASLVYGFSGSTSFEAIANVARAEADNVGLIVGLVFLISGLAFKVSAAPFHMWTPDVYEGAPTPVTAFFAAAPKLAAMALFARALIAPFPEIIADWRPVIMMIAVASMAVGSFSALAQTNIKRLMAYSSIGHMGFALVGLAAGTDKGVSGLLVYMASYVVMTIGVFACILMMRRRGGMTENISDLAGLSQTNPGFALAMTILFLSLLGFPPTGGFFGKLFVFGAAVDEGLIWLAVVGVVLSAVAAYYYLRVLWIMWFDAPAPAFERAPGWRRGATAAAAAALMLPVILIAIGPLQSAANDAAAALF
ncbi:MAG: NADH-quinone oxidoreductase subunit NuoN [Parvularculaceae bacterium]